MSVATRTRPPAPARGPEHVGPVFWLEQALAEDAGPHCPPLAGVTRADVCIVGGGYLGLWTALELLDRAPDARVVVLEAEGCGFGASGRNGGWATSWHDELHDLAERFGPDQARWLAERATAAIDRIEELCGEEQIDCHLRRAGALWAATTAAQLGVWEPALAACRALGRERFVEPLDAAEVRARTGSPLPLDGILFRDGAALQPALLARGLRRVALRRGVRIHEGSPMTRLSRESAPVVHTPAGRVEAGHVVLALGAWAARVRELRRAIVPIGSHMVVTEPLPEAIAELGWCGGELFGDPGLLVHYAQATPDGRVAFGRAGGAIGAFGRVGRRHMEDPRAVRGVATSLRRWFPQLAGARLTHAWGGAVDRAPGHLPFAGTLGDHGTVHYATGFSGNGVAPSALFGRILARSVLGADDEYTRCALTGGPPGYLPPEPVRTLGGMLVRGAVERATAAEEDERAPDRLSARLRGLASFSMPRALEPRAWPSPRR